MADGDERDDHSDQNDRIDGNSLEIESLDINDFGEGDNLEAGHYFAFGTNSSFTYKHVYLSVIF